MVGFHAYLPPLTNTTFEHSVRSTRQIDSDAPPVFLISCSKAILPSDSDRVEVLLTQH